MDNNDDHNDNTVLDESHSLDDDLDSYKVFYKPPQVNHQSKQLAMRQQAKVQVLIMCYNSAHHLALVVNLMALPNTPKTIEEALSCPEKEFWHMAIDSEMKSLIKNGTWTEILTLPNGWKALPCKWVFKIKLNSTGSIEQYKARLVVKGFKQIKGLDYTETFAPVVKFSMIHLMLAVAASLDLEIEQMDFSTAFLNGDLTEEIYILGLPGSHLDGKLLLLIKSLYSLKQAPCCWNHKIDTYLKQEGFKCCHTDNCLYVKNGFYALLYVDDILLLTNNSEMLALTKQHLMENFDMQMHNTDC